MHWPSDPKLAVGAVLGLLAGLYCAASIKFSLPFSGAALGTSVLLFFAALLIIGGNDDPEPVMIAALVVFGLCALGSLVGVLSHSEGRPTAPQEEPASSEQTNGGSRRLSVSWTSERFGSMQSDQYREGQG